MNRKLVFHLCILAALICLAVYFSMDVADTGPRYTEEELQEAFEDGRAEYDEISGDLVMKGEKRGVRLGFPGQAIALLVVVAIYAAILFTTYVLPSIVHRFTHMVYDSGEELEEDPMHDARSLFAQGDFLGAIKAYREVAQAQPDNRFPWVEMAKIQHDNLENPDAAIETLREALVSNEWRENDAAFLMFRLAELYEVDKGDQATSIDILKQVVDTFPETRHSANATHRLRELGAI